MLYRVTNSKEKLNDSSRKFPSLKHELVDLNSLLSDVPDTGTSLSNDTYKVRLSIRSKGKGKSGGARIITYVVTDNKRGFIY